jgi:tetratricopeptide (TPR) repeat protein
MGGASDNLDLGFSLELEGNARGTAGGRPAALPFPSARVASEGMAEAAAADKVEIPALAPPAMRGASAARAMRPVVKKKGLPGWAFILAGGIAATLATIFVLLPMLRSAPSPDAVIRSFQPELAKDNLPAYQSAVAELTKTADAFKDTGTKLRLRAAELLLTSFVAHGGLPADVTRAEQLLEGASTQPKLAPALGRARALLAVAKGKPREAESSLGDRSAVESQLILGLAQMADDKAGTAVDPLRRYLAAKPTDVLGHYLLGKALLTSAPTDARKEFELALAKNPAHAGAMIGLARVEETPEKRLSAARELAEKKMPGAGPTELADLQLLIGQSAQALGRTPEAIDAFQRAVNLDRRLIAAYVSLGESLLYEGKYAQALERLRAAGPALEKSTAGKFGLGGALIATGNSKQGLEYVGTAAKERPDDPRGPFWTGFAAGAQEPQDLAAAEQGYRDAIKRDPKFLPASLKLAALLQQQDKAADSLAVLRAAEEAGAPPAVLQLAWGEALIVAKEPAKAEAIFQKVLDTDDKSISARLGVASALEAQGKLAEAKASLEGTLKAMPETLGCASGLPRSASSWVPRTKPWRATRRKSKLVTRRPPCAWRSRAWLLTWTSSSSCKAKPRKSSTSHLATPRPPTSWLASMKPTAKRVRLCRSIATPPRGATRLPSPSPTADSSTRSASNTKPCSSMPTRWRCRRDVWSGAASTSVAATWKAPWPIFKPPPR